MLDNVFFFTIDFKNREATQQLIDSIDGLVENFWVLINDEDPVSYKASTTRIKTHRIGYNAGFAHACNQAITLCKEIDFGYIFQINNDAKLTTDGNLEAFVSEFHKNQSLAMASPLIKKQNGDIEYAGSHWLSGPRLAIICTRKNIPQDQSCIYSTFINGACFIGRISALNKVGGFDSDYFAYREEHDLALRLRQGNYKLACLPRLTIEHTLSQTSNRYADFKSFLLFRGQYLFSLKNYCTPSRYLFTVLLIVKQALKLITNLKSPKTAQGIISASRLCFAKSKESYAIEGENITFLPDGKWHNLSQKTH